MMINMKTRLTILGRMLTEERSAVGVRGALTAALVSVVTVAVGTVFMVMAERTHQHLDAYVRIALDAARMTRLAL